MTSGDATVSVRACRGWLNRRAATTRRRFARTLGPAETRRHPVELPAPSHSLDCVSRLTFARPRSEHPVSSSLRLFVSPQSLPQCRGRTQPPSHSTATTDTSSTKVVTCDHSASSATSRPSNAESGNCE